MRHFALCRKRILAQARRWTLEAEVSPLFPRFKRSYEELLTLLSSDDLVLHRLPGKASVDDEDAPLEATIPPNESDLRALRSLDPAFFQRISSVGIINQGESADEAQNRTFAGQPEHAASAGAQLSAVMDEGSHGVNEAHDDPTHYAVGHRGNVDAVLGPDMAGDEDAYNKDDGGTGTARVEVDGSHTDEMASLPEALPGAATEQHLSQDASGYNPWAAGAVGQSVANQDAQEREDDDVKEEDADFYS
jgi:hypothetical protein